MRGRMPPAVFSIAFNGWTGSLVMTKEAPPERISVRRSARRLTEAAIQRTRPPNTGRVDIADAIVTGLYLRITVKDKRSWSLLYPAPGQKRQQRLTLGRWPLVSVAEARKLARDALIDAAAGNDPAIAKREQRRQRSDLVEDVVVEFVERVLKVQQRRWAATEAIMNDKLVRRWKRRPIGQSRKSDVLKMLDREMDAGHGRMANRTLQISRQFFSWAIERGYLDHDPTAGVNRPAKERTRDRVLSGTEISAIWQASSQWLIRTRHAPRCRPSRPALAMHDQEPRPIAQRRTVANNRTRRVSMRAIRHVGARILTRRTSSRRWTPTSNACVSPSFSRFLQPSTLWT